MANTYLSKSLGTPTNNKKWTFSAWCKRSLINVTSTLMSSGSSAVDAISMASNGKFNYVIAAGNSGQLTTTRLFQDVSGWYHIVVAVDTTQGTAANRVKIYINGVQETSFSTSTYPSQNFNTKINSAVLHTIGGYSSGSSGDFWNGSMSHIHFVDGIQYAPTVFGSVDSTSGIWKINTSPSVTYGNNGFFILKDGNTITDSSANSNNFSLGAGAITKTEDCPSNVFATFNPLNSWGDTVLTNGNTTAGNTGTSAGHVSSTIHMNSGKWYMEFNVNTHLTGYSAPMFLLAGTGVFQNLQVGWNASGDGSYGIGSNAKKITDGVVSNASFSDLNAGNKVQIAYDADAGKAWFGINGAYLDSGNPTTAANPYFTTTKLQNNDVSLIILGYNGNAMSANFGNGYFGTTAITTNSGNGYSGAEGSSKFNYTVPTGYSALNTKGLNL